MAMTQTQKTDAYQFFIVAFGAVTGVEYMNQLNDAYGAGMTTKQIVNVYTTKPQFTTQYPTFLTNEQFAQKLIANVVGSSASAEAKAGAEADVIASLNAGWTRGDVIFQIFSNLAAKPHDDADWGNTAKMFANKVAVAQYLTEVKLVNETDMAKLQAPLGNVTADSDVSSPAAIDKLVNVATPGQTELTLGNDNIVAAQEGLTFTASIKQNALGGVANTLESGDVIIAKGTGNKLVADVAASGLVAGTDNAPAISPATKNVQVVEFRAQNVGQSGGVHASQANIDAQKMEGVQQWWSVNSRNDLKIEDVRSRPEDTTIGMRNTDPEASFKVYFDPEQLKANGTVKNSALTLTLDKISAPGDLSHNVFNGVKFTLGGKSITLQSDAIGAATTHAELLAALEAAAKDNADLAGVTFKLNADNTITLTDAAGKAFGTGSWLTPTGDIPAAGDFKWAQKVGEPERGTELISTNVELDNVGRTSAGGDLDIGSLGNGGVEKFNVAVDRASWLSSMKSQDHLGQNGGTNAGPQHQFLQEVVLTNKGANGDLKVGNVVANRLDDRLENGLTNVRVVDGSAFKGNLNLGINLNNNANNGSVVRYLNKSTKPVEFNYTGGQGADLLNISVNANVAEHKNFVMNVNTGAGDDRLVLAVAKSGAVTRLNTTSVDGGEGTNTIVMNADVGMATGVDAGKDVFKSFKNFQNYEIEGGNHNFATLDGVKSVVVATDANVSTTLRNLPVDLNTVTVTGKNQTVGNNANANQLFGTLTLEAAKSTEATVVLDNTALVDAALVQSKLLVADQATDPTNKSAVRTLDVVSNGKSGAATSNYIGDVTVNAANVVTGLATGGTNGINAENVSTINLSGDHNLGVRINAAANSTSAATPAKVDNLKVDGSAMAATANLNLMLNSAVVTNVDNVAKKTVTLIGGAGAKDVLTFDGAVTSTNRTTVSGFETVAYTDGANVDAANFSGVSLYKLAGNIAADKIVNLKSVENFELGTTTAGAGNAISLQTTQTGASSALNIAVKATGGAVNAQELGTSGYTTLNLKIDNKAADLNKAYSFDLSKVGIDGNGNSVVVSSGAANVNDTQFFTKAALQNVVLTGGTGNANAVADSVNLGILSAVVKNVDVTGYKGKVTAKIGDALTDGAAANAKTTGNTAVKVGAYAVDFTDADHTGAAHVDTVTAFVFTTDAFKDAAGVVQKWEIKGFQGIKAGAAGVAGSLDNLTVLDLSALGIKGLQDMNISEAGGVVTIKSNLSHNFVIELSGVHKDQLDLANFKFAV